MAETSTGLNLNEQERSISEQRLVHFIGQVISDGQVQVIDCLGGPYLDPEWKTSFEREEAYIDWYESHPTITRIWRGFSQAALLLGKADNSIGRVRQWLVGVDPESKEALQSAIATVGSDLVRSLSFAMFHPDAARRNFVEERLHDVDMYMFITDTSIVDSNVIIEGFKPDKPPAASAYNRMRNANLGNRDPEDQGNGMLVAFSRVSQASPDLVNDWQSSEEAMPIIRYHVQALVEKCLCEIQLTVRGSKFDIYQNSDGHFFERRFDEETLERVDVPLTEKTIDTLVKFLSIESS